VRWILPTNHKYVLLHSFIQSYTNITSISEVCWQDLHYHHNTHNTHLLARGRDGKNSDILFQNLYK
jgi:hypothetical protein